MRAQFVIPVLASILILGTLGLSYDVFADKDDNNGKAEGCEKANENSKTREKNPHCESSLEVNWNLSAEVMPAPPFGTIDIPGSDEQSTLVVTLSESGDSVILSGTMGGLAPNTVYTVYVSKAYVPFTNWLGLYPGVGAFTFVTDSNGAAEWEIQVSPVSGFPEMSVWIDNRKTLLISDNFTIDPLNV